jgi:hypothetical protein
MTLITKNYGGGPQLGDVPATGPTHDLYDEEGKGCGQADSALRRRDEECVLYCFDNSVMSGENVPQNS